MNVITKVKEAKKEINWLEPKLLNALLKKTGNPYHWAHKGLEFN